MGKKKNVLPLKEVSIEGIFLDKEKVTYEIPIYQRNYAWEKDEITAFIQDVYDAFKKDSKKVYYIGTLVSFHKGEQIYEIIDGQQRLTTIRLILSALGIKEIQSNLTYRARKKSDITLNHIPEFNVDEADVGIVNGYEHAEKAYKDIVSLEEKDEFISYFKENVHLIHYQVPKDIDLNHYFEIMNSRGEQLEKHEIVKAKLIEKIGKTEEDKEKADNSRKWFNQIWEACSEMSVYVQQNFKYIQVFGESLRGFIPVNFEEIASICEQKEEEQGDEQKLFVSIKEILAPESIKKPGSNPNNKEEMKDSFLPIIDFSNFLLIVLKITRMKEKCFEPVEFVLDDKELLNEFDAADVDPKIFAYNLLKARFFLDNFVVHHSKEEDTIENNPWKLQQWQKDKKSRREYPKNISENEDLQDKLVQLLSMFEVSFTARQRKNYLFYCLFYLMNQEEKDKGEYVERYAEFVEELADKYFHMVYLDCSKLNAINTPLPRSFDETILKFNADILPEFNTDILTKKSKDVFYSIYGDGKENPSKGIPLFVFNYIDFKLWKMYANSLRGERLKENRKKRLEFFESIGCGDFGLKIFERFYFSRTRRSLEHYYPQAMATGKDGYLNDVQINCLGNYAMIGSAVNSLGSDWSPKAKLDYYLDSSGKINQISVASLKFMVMMQMCKDEEEWRTDMIQKHQEKMLDIIMADLNR